MVRRRSLQALLVFSLTMFFVALQPLSASAATLGPYIIRQDGSRKCMEVPLGGAGTVGTQLVTQNCFGNRQPGSSGTSTTPTPLLVTGCSRMFGLRCAPPWTTGW